MTSLTKELPVLKRLRPTFQIMPKHFENNHVPIVFLHGFMGSKMHFKHYALSIGMNLNRNGYVVDARNHGSCHPKCLPMNYEVMTNDLEEFREYALAKEPYTLETKMDLFGYSMGAKTAMNFALRNPSQVRRLLILDNAPISQPIDSQIRKYIDASKSLKAWFDTQSKVNNTWKAKGFQKLKELIPENDNLCYYILSGFKKSKGKIVFQSAEYIFEDETIEELGEFPEHLAPVDHEVLVIKAAQSDMINVNGETEFRRLFPNHKIVELDTDHESLLIDFREQITKLAINFFRHGNIQ